MNQRLLIQTLIFVFVIVFGLIGCTDTENNFTNGDNQLTLSEDETENINEEINTQVKPNNQNVVVYGSADISCYDAGWFKHSVEELEEDSVAILTVTVLFSEKPNCETLAEMPIGSIEPEEVQITLTTVRIDEVFKSDSVLDIRRYGHSRGRL